MRGTTTVLINLAPYSSIAFGAQAEAKEKQIFFFISKIGYNII